MLVETQYLGAVDIPEENIIRFPEGIYGFEEVTEFALIPRGIKEDSLMLLQALGQPHPSFVLFEPGEFVNDFHPKVAAQDLRKLGVKDAGALSFFVIAVIPPEIQKATANYKSPIAINQKTHTGMQVILENKNYPLRFPLFEDVPAEQAPPSGKEEQPCL